MSLSSTPPRSVPPVAPDVRGVFEANPLNPPTPPSDAKAVEIRDSSDHLIGYSWVIGEHADEHFYAVTWTYLDHRDPATPPSGPRLLR